MSDAPIEPGPGSVAVPVTRPFVMLGFIALLVGLVVISSVRIAVGDHELRSLVVEAIREEDAFIRAQEAAASARSASETAEPK